jgi:hypothetical protein
MSEYGARNEIFSEIPCFLKRLPGDLKGAIEQINREQKLFSLSAESAISEHSRNRDYKHPTFKAENVSQSVPGSVCPALRQFLACFFPSDIHLEYNETIYASVQCLPPHTVYAT